MKNWWKELGKWQALAVIVTPAIYFIILYFFGDKQLAYVALVLVLVLAFAFAAFALATALAIAFAAFALATAFTTALAIASLAYVAVAVVAVFFTVKEEEINISKKAISFSYMVEFFVVLTIIFFGSFR